MRVIGIRRVGRILPDVGMAEAFLFERSRQLLFVHRIILANAGQSAAPKTATPSLRHWGTPQKGRVRLQERRPSPTTKSGARGRRRYIGGRPSPRGTPGPPVGNPPTPRPALFFPVIPPRGGPRRRPRAPRSARLPA